MLNSSIFQEIPSSFLLHNLQVLAKIPKTLLCWMIPNMNPWLTPAPAPDQGPLAHMLQRLPKHPADIVVAPDTEEHQPARCVTLWLSTLSSARRPQPCQPFLIVFVQSIWSLNWSFMVTWFKLRSMVACIFASNYLVLPVLWIHGAALQPSTCNRYPWVGETGWPDTLLISWGPLWC